METFLRRENEDEVLVVEGLELFGETARVLDEVLETLEGFPEVLVGVVETLDELAPELFAEALILFRSRIQNLKKSWKMQNTMKKTRQCRFRQCRHRRHRRDWSKPEAKLKAE